MILLALDTSDARGSVALLRDDQLLQVTRHDTGEDYSSWVLPTVDRLLTANQLKMQDVNIYAVSAGPGSFTGLRVGLTSLKAWSEVYGQRIAAVSRLEAIASQAETSDPLIAAFFDAQREQLFGGLFRRDGAQLRPVGEEMVIPPEGFLHWVEEQSAAAPVSWISMDPEKLTALNAWRKHSDAGAVIQQSTHVLAPAIGRIGLQRACEGRLTDALALDAQYVRRSDAEIFWKGYAAK
jgi:tRNA threonylcarbamoyladenosine biosynthesis protein TsaB